MASTATGVAALYPDWPQYAARLADAVRDLTPEQLAWRASRDQMPIWGIAAHTAGMRAYWLCNVFGEPGAATTPFGDPLPDDGWEDDEDHPRSADEVASALDSTWSIVADCLGRWTLPMLDEAFERRYAGTLQTHTRGSVLNRMFSHDAFHAGEISQLLVANGVEEGIDLWRRTWPTI